MDERLTISYKHFFQQLVEALPWPILIIDADLQVLFCNRYVGTLFGQNGRLTGKSLGSLLEDEAILHLVELGVQTCYAQSAEFERSGSDGVWKVSITPVEHRKTKQGGKGTRRTQAEQEIKTLPRPAYRYFSIVIEDLSELRRLERVRRDFVANISHELRTPLTSINLLAETLEDAIETDPDQAQLFIERIETEVRYLNDLVAELLELSRIEAGNVPMSIEPIESEMLVREAMARMLPQAQRHRVHLRTSIEQGKTLVAADSKLIARVLVNLVHNAIKFTPSGGTIIIGTRHRRGDTMQSFFVSDTGVGIAPEDLPRVFERFYKVGQSRARTNFIGPGGGGSGLGLAIARHVIEAHGGRISATSEPGQGSTFTFTLSIVTSITAAEATAGTE